MNTVAVKKEFMDLKESMEAYIEGLRGQDLKREML